MTEPSKSNTQAVNLLWTGGWDSTFQLLRLLLEQKQPVTPYYLIDEDRRSTAMELQTIKRIKQALAAYDPSCIALLNPTRFFSKQDIPPNPAITQAFTALRETYRLGHQYDWLSRFCAHQQVTGLQLCVTQALRRSSGMAYLDRTVAIDDAMRQSPEHIVFQYFDFPTVTWTKKAMEEAVRQQGWEKLMALTWFCHHPRHNKPCGRCSPCQCTIREGLAYRVPFSRRLLAPVRQTLSTLRRRKPAV